MAAITSPDYPDERLIVCRNPDLARERRRKREALLAATERALTAIQRAVERRHQPLRGATKIALKVGAALDRHKMAKHFDLTISSDRFTVARKTEAIAAEAALDGIYIVRTSLPAAILDNAGTVAGRPSQTDLRPHRRRSGRQQLPQPARRPRHADPQRGLLDV
jgi:hypothetical protein